jgi:hypothetical protein
MRFEVVESKDNIKGYPLGDKAIDDDDKLMICNSEQVTRCIPHACCSIDGSSDDRECDSRGVEMMNYDFYVFVPRAGLDATEGGGGTLAIQNRQLIHITTKDETAVTTDQLHEVINELV